MQQKKRFTKVVIVLGSLLVLYLGANVYFAKQYISPPRKTPGQPPLSMKNLQIDGPGHKIPAWASAGVANGNPKSNNLFVLVHGYKGSRESWRDVAQKLVSKQQEVIVLGMRGHDLSPIEHCGFAHHETKEVASAVTWARKQYQTHHCNVILVGMSLGTASCWKAAEQDPTIGAVVSDSGFANLEEATTNWLQRDLFAGHILLKPMIMLAEYIIQAKTSEVIPEKFAERWKGKPALVIHGTQDKLLDMSHAQRISKAADCPLWMVEGAQHASCYELNLDEYADKLIGTAHKALKTSLSTALVR